MMETYDQAKQVKNTCPNCGRVGNYRLRYKYPDEGRMVCVNCKYSEQQKAEELSAASNLSNARNALLSGFQNVLNLEKDCADELLNILDEYLETKLGA